MQSRQYKRSKLVECIMFSPMMILPNETNIQLTETMTENRSLTMNGSLLDKFCSGEELTDSNSTS